MFDTRMTAIPSMLEANDRTACDEEIHSISRRTIKVNGKSRKECGRKPIETKVSWILHSANKERCQNRPHAKAKQRVKSKSNNSLKETVEEVSNLF